MHFNLYLLYWLPLGFAASLAKKGTNKKRNRQTFVDGFCFFLRAYTRCGPEGRYYGRSNRCYDLYNKLKRFLLCHGFVRLLG